MNFVEYNKVFLDKYVDEETDIFQAVNIWAKDANDLYSQLNGVISKSEALSSVLSGTLPENLNSRSPIQSSEKAYIRNYVKQVLSAVDDKKVQLYVVKTINKSYVEKNLVFIYGSDLSSGQKARVRILSKLIWYNLYPEKGITNGK